MRVVRTITGAAAACLLLFAPGTLAPSTVALSTVALSTYTQPPVAAPHYP
jgi:hypothetical protein